MFWCSNQVNFHLYHYAGNNPVRYIDPTGESSVPNFYVLSIISYKIHHNYSKIKGNNILNTIAMGKTVNCSSIELYYLYKTGKGQNVSLSEIGLLETIQNSVEKGTSNTKTGESIQDRYKK